MPEVAIVTLSEELAWMFDLLLLRLPAEQGASILLPRARALIEALRYGLGDPVRVAWLPERKSYYVRLLLPEAKAPANPPGESGPLPESKSDTRKLPRN